MAPPLPVPPAPDLARELERLCWALVRIAAAHYERERRSEDRAGDD